MTRSSTRKALTNYTLGFLPTFLFLILGTSLGLHWWHLPWSHHISVGLIWLMIILEVLTALLFGISGMLVFLTWWHGKLRVFESKRLDLAYISTILSPHHTLIAIWGIGAAIGRNWLLVLDAALTLSIVSRLMSLWLKQMPKRKTGNIMAKHSGTG